MFKLLIHILFLVFFIPTIHGQEFVFKPVNVDAGLSHNMVFCTMQDEYGFMWFGTKDGLNRYDGYKIKIFRNTPDVAKSLGNNDIRALLNKSKNEIWVGTWKGLFIFDVLTEQFLEIKRFANTLVSALLKDGPNVWVISNHNLYRISPTDTTKFEFPPGTISSLCRLHNGDIWIGTATGKIGVYNRFTHHFDFKDAFEARYRGSRLIEKIREGYNDNLLIGTSSAGLKSYHIPDSTFQDILINDNNAKPLYVRDILKNDRDHEMWIATESGIYILTPNHHIKHHIVKDLKNSEGLTDNAIYTLTYDCYGNIWIGTYFKGICMYPRPSLAFKTTFPGFQFSSVNDELLFKNTIIREICQDNYNNLWIGTEDNGIFKLDYHNQKISHVSPSALPKALSYYNIHGMLCSNDTLWAGSFERGLDLIDIKTGKVFQHFDKRTHPDLRSDFIITFCKTKDGRIYIGTGGGLQLYNYSTRTFDTVKGIPSDFVYTLMESHDGLLYVGTEDNGVLIYNPHSEKVTYLNHILKSSAPLPAFKVNCLYEGTNGNIFIGTDRGGMFVYHPQRQQLSHYYTSNGMPSNFIYKILQDTTGNIWCTSSVGLIQMNSNLQVLKVFTKENGLPSNQFNYNSGFLNKDGMLYFGTTNGLVYFSPINKHIAQLKIPLYFTGLKILGKEITMSHTSSPLRRSLLSSDSLTLGYNQSTFSIDFSALVYSSQSGVVYSYRLAGIEDKWAPVNESSTIYFTQLPQGNYKLQIAAASPFDISYTNSTISLHITILPPFWKSNWAYTFYTLVITVLLYILVQYYHRHQKKLNARKIEEFNHHREIEINQAKIDFFTNIAHEIKTPLTLIQGPVEDLLDRLAQNDHTQYELKLIEKNTNRLLELTNQLLDFRKIESNMIRVNPIALNPAYLVREVYETFTIAARSKNLNYRLQVKEEEHTIVTDKDLLTKILYNLFNNGIKYSDSLFEIILHPGNAEDTLILEFINNGDLIPQEAFSKIFQPFYRFEQSEFKEGSGIGLSFAYSLAKLLQGDITVNVCNDKNIFTLTLPKKVK